MFSSRKLTIAICFIIFAILTLNIYDVESRYLPTRGVTADRLDKLRELLKDVSKFVKLLENELDKEEYQADSPPRWHPESKLFYKRDVTSH